MIEIGSTATPSIASGGEDYLAVLSNRTKDEGYTKIIINSLDFFLSQYNQEDVLKTIYAAKISNLKNKGALFIVMTKGIHGDLFEKKMESLADCVLELNVIQKGSVFERFLSVKKMRNYAKKIGIARYVIDDSGFVLMDRDFFRCYDGRPYAAKLGSFAGPAFMSGALPSACRSKTYFCRPTSQNSRYRWWHLAR